MRQGGRRSVVAAVLGGRPAFAEHRADYRYPANGFFPAHRRLASPPRFPKSHQDVQSLVAASGQTVKMLEGLLRPVRQSIRSGLRPCWRN